MSAVRLCRLLMLAAVLVPGGVAARPPVSDPFKVVEIAGDGSLAVFDNAVSALDARLGESPADRQRLSAALPAGPGSILPATVPRIVRAVGAMRPGPGQGCLVFATSHGVRQQGLYLSIRNEVLTPQALDRALLQGCGGAPTAVIVSSCFSGSFARPPMTRPNRVILTAARPDRTSFGCQAGRTYTVYDQCLLDALDREAGWMAAYGSIRACVGAEERRERATPSEPQAWFGAAADAVPWPRATPPR